MDNNQKLNGWCVCGNIPTDCTCTHTKPVHAKPSLYAFYFEAIKAIGLKYGYNIVLHGSMNRDLDLIAVPWQEKLGDKETMLSDVAECLGGFILKQATSVTHHGREQWVININRTLEHKFDGMAVNVIKHLDPQYYIDISVF